jgi:putative acetyltransferase
MHVESLPGDIARVREETTADHEGIRRVNRVAFDGEDEARLVDRLRTEGLFIASLVAVEADQVAGHILFSDLPIETDTGEVHAAALAPMAVLPNLQRQGVGAMLIREGLKACAGRGYGIVIVLGHPDYYPRFGFSAALTGNLQSPFTGSEAFMAMEITDGALDGVQGVVRYPEAFGVDAR